MQLDLPVILGIAAIVTPMAVYRGKKSGYLILAAAMSWVLVFLGVYFEPDFVFIASRNPITAYLVEGFLGFLTIFAEIVGLYQLKN